jgi:methylamine---glutamate N-methyltransferase subunit A
MCGIVGFLDRARGGEAEIGRTILGMLNALGCRGPDSAGVALFAVPGDHQFVVRVKLGEETAPEAKARELATLVESRSAASGFAVTGSYARFLVNDRTDTRQLAAGIESLLPDLEVVSIGRRLEIVKQVGSPANLEKTYCISHFRGSHGLGHTRLSTESRVDLSHSQPFWAHGYPDLAVVHNGHITNYHQLRRRYEQRHVRFYTENDSEIIGIYLAEQLTKGRTLKEALDAMLRDLDGSYSCLVATESDLAFVKDPFALKPLVFAETDKFIAIATEEIAIRSAVPGDYVVREAQVKEVRVWQR